MMGEEIFREINGYKGLYQVSNYGRVKSLHNGEKILKLVKSKNGYIRVKLKLKGHEKFLFVHRLVASAFILNPYNLPEINHKDENKTNNRVENLEWCTREYNVNYGTRNSRCGLEYKKIVCLVTNETFNSITEAVKKYNIDHSSIIQCCKGKRKTAGCLNGGKLKWQYVL